MCKTLVYDIGGTTIRAAVYEWDTQSLTNIVKILNYKSIKSNTVSAEKKYIVKSMIQIGKDVMKNENPHSIVVAYPGPIKDNRIALASPTIISGRIRQYNLYKIFNAHWPYTKIVIMNDVSAAGYRYIEKGRENFCIITVSSGIGNKIFINGEPFIGNMAHGGEIGHLKIDTAANAILCGCGESGHLGAISSGRATLNLLIKSCSESTLRRIGINSHSFKDEGYEHYVNKRICSAFLASEKWAREIISKMAEPLGMIIASIQLAIGIDRFIIIGGFAHALGNEYIELLKGFASNYSWNLSGKWSEMIELGFTDQHDALYGAGLYAQRKLSDG